MTQHPADRTPAPGPRAAARPSQVVHPRKARILAVVSWLLAAGFVVLALVTRPVMWGAVGLAVAGAALAWVLIWRPRVELDPDGLTIVNPVRTVRIPWQRVRRVGSRWSLEVESETGMHRAWAVGSSYRDPSGVDHTADVTGLGLLRKIDAARTGADPQPLKPEFAMLEDLQSVASTVRGARDAHADALADGHIEADPTPTTRTVAPLPAAAMAVGLLLPLAVWFL
ncbi:PH domain-containing protein [Kytococcus schroeteri]|nr:PH domain-containing protein [Kytococcus schroeteri]